MTPARTLIIVHDPDLNARDSARMTGHLLELAPLLNEPSVKMLRTSAEVRWLVPTGLVHAASMWWPMLISAYAAIGRDVTEQQIIELRVKEVKP